MKYYANIQHYLVYHDNCRIFVVMESVRHPIVQTDSPLNNTITYGTLTLYLDPTFRREDNARQYGFMGSDFKELGLKTGEKVYVHYLSFSMKPQLPPDKWLVDKRQIYCVIRDGKIVMLNNYILIDILSDGIKSDIIIMPGKKKLTNRGIVVASNNEQLSPGDEIIFKDIGAFENEIEGKTYYIAQDEDLLAKIKK